MAIDNLPLFNAMNREEVKPPFPHPRRPLTSQEAHFAIMEKVNACIQEVNHFEQRVRVEIDNFMDRATAENNGFKEAIQASYNAFMETVQREVNNFEVSAQNNFDLFRNDIDKRVADFETAINNSFETLQSEVLKASNAKIEEMEQLKINLNKMFSDYKATVNEICNNFKTQVNQHIKEQDEKIEAYKKYMVDNLPANVKAVFEQKASNGEIAEIMGEVYGSTRTFKGALSYDEIQAITDATNGDYYFCTTDEHYYQRTTSAWVDIGNGDKIADDYEAYKLFMNEEIEGLSNPKINIRYVGDRVTSGSGTGENGNESTLDSNLINVNGINANAEFEIDYKKGVGFIRHYFSIDNDVINNHIENGVESLLLMVNSNIDIDDIALLYGYSASAVVRNQPVILQYVGSIKKGLNVLKLPLNSEEYNSCRAENEALETPSRFHVHWLIGTYTEYKLNTLLSDSFIKLEFSVLTDEFKNGSDKIPNAVHALIAENAEISSHSLQAEKSVHSSNAVNSVNALNVGVTSLVDSELHLNNSCKGYMKNGVIYIVYDDKSKVVKDNGFSVPIGKHEELLGKKVIIKKNEVEGFNLNNFSVNPTASWGSPNDKYYSVSQFATKTNTMIIFDYDNFVDYATSQGQTKFDNVYLMAHDTTKFPVGVSDEWYRYCDIAEGEEVVNNYTVYITTNDSMIFNDTINEILERLNVLEGGTDVNLQKSNVLFGKKYVACGDSFTQGDFTGYADENGLSGKNSSVIYDTKMNVYKTYPWWIATRNNMTLVNEALCGSIVPLSKEYLNGDEGVVESSRSPFSLTRYQQIPADADYITFWFGINDASHTNLGTINDTTNETFYGAWNVVLEWLIENRPNAKMGMIVTTGSNENYRKAVREVAVKWGIPYLDMMGEETPLLFGKETGVCARAVELRKAQFYVTSSNSHPNVEAHKNISTTIEAFLRRL